MAFAFTFSVPSIPNPFSVQRPSTINDEQAADGDMGGVVASRLEARPRKRTWLPNSSSTVPSLAVSAAVSEPGYLDTPSKYLDAVASSSGPGEDLMEDDDDEHARLRGPPTKKRRTIADSIISTALSAALIGAAVGIAAYRVYARLCRACSINSPSSSCSWRDRGKPSPAPQHTDAPPPPYHPGDWVSVPPPTPSHSSEPVTIPQQHHTLPKAARRSRRTHAVAGASSHRRKPSHIPIHSHHHSASSVSPRKQHFDIEPAAASSSTAEPTEFDEHVDWMGAQLSRLISEGKRALGRDVVLPATEQPGPGTDDADVDDDDQEAWEDEQQHQHAAMLSSSYRGRSHLSPFSSSAPPRSPLAQHHHQYMSSSASLQTPTSTRTAEDDDTLSPELRDFMAQARSARRRA